MPLRSTEILLKRTGIRIGYDMIRAAHALVLDANQVIIEAKPLEDASGGEALTMQARLAGWPQRSTLNDAVVIFSEATKPPERRLEEFSKTLSLVSLSDSGEYREEKPGHIVLRRLAGVHIAIEPYHKFVEYTISPNVRRRAENLHIEAYSPTLVNILLDKLQTATVFYLGPTQIEIQERGNETIITVKPLKGHESRAASEN
ncbi:hypothetical protein Pyrfu_1568 [Pyrolobus fumarii 1A]|uniref:Uncharacterized protein n=1 Tax=Pyrolobus fumarii (strain DSM 11204 / 1A) TaxID=694429 RepID=G0EC55_PYRF1|nr:hypothetical protein [Pyrolobus fumarii]AEM39425.1 hypothetical protein Pyrfu_1568 [Pyrolobus fumarii 1A]